MGSLTFFDLFAGVGGFRLGFEREGYRCVGFCEIDKHARKLYKAYYKTEEEFEWDDVLTLNPDDMPNFNILTAGFSCQPFSISGRREGLYDRDGRGLTLWNAMFGIIERKRPPVCVFENVKGLLSANRGWSFAYFLYKMDEFGYDAEWTVFNSKAFGVPQNRERLYIVCYFREECRGQIFPFAESDKVYYSPPTVDEGIYQDSQTELAGTLTARQYASWNGNFVCSPTNPVRIGQIGKGGQGERIYSISRTSTTLSANGGGRGAKTGLYLTEDLRIRRLTPLECFRLQGFPDNIYRKAKELGISDAQLYKMTGNAVTVQIPQSIARKLRKVVFGKE